MTSGKTKHQLENDIRELLHGLLKHVNSLDPKHLAYDGAIERIINHHVNKITDKTIELPKFVGDLGQLRGFIRKKRSTLDGF